MTMTDDELRSLVALHKSAAEAQASGATSFDPAAYRAVALNRCPWLCNELLAARATIAAIRKAAEMYSRDELSANIRMIGNDLLSIIDHTAKGK